MSLVNTDIFISHIQCNKWRKVPPDHELRGRFCCGSLNVKCQDAEEADDGAGGYEYSNAYEDWDLLSLRKWIQACFSIFRLLLYSYFTLVGNFNY